MLLYFWNGSAYQPLASAYQKKYKDRGLVVISVHPSKGSDGLNALVKEQQIDLPIAIDTTTTVNERAYTVKIWPTYFLIDKSGKVVRGYLEHPPTDKEIEELLK